MSLCTVSAAVTLYAWISTWRGQYNTIWPLRVLRILVTTIVTVGFIPIMRMLMRPLQCDRLAESLHEDVRGSGCFSGPTAAYAVLGALGLIFIVPFSLFMQLVYFIDNLELFLFFVLLMESHCYKIWRVKQSPNA